MTENLFASVPSHLQQELIEILVESPEVRIERILSTGHCSPEGFWYDQPESEWVVVLQGAARLLLEGDAEPISLETGDHLLIPARRKHRVEWTSPTTPTLWLAVFF